MATPKAARAERPTLPSPDDMQPLPHLYSVAAASPAIGLVALSAHGVPDLSSAPPVEFGGPGDQWSPEALLLGAMSSCFILSFRAVARASKLEWERLECTVEGKLERIAGIMRFTHVVTRAKLLAPFSATAEQCQRALEKAEHGCLIANSLSAQRELQMQILRTKFEADREAAEVA